MQSQGMRLRHKGSHMPCNLVNFIVVNQESEVRQGRQRGEDMRKKQRSKVEKSQQSRKGVQGGALVTTTMDSTMSSDVWSAQSLCRLGGHGEDEVRQQGGEDESKRAPRSMCCSFIGAFAHVQSTSVYVQFVPYMLPAWTSPLLLVHAQVLSCRLLWQFFQRPGGDDIGNAETKPVCSSLLQ